MRIIIILPIVLIAACNVNVKQSSAEDTKSDTASDRKQIIAAMDSMHATMNGGMVINYSKHFTDDALFLGTDPAEYWNLTGMVDYMKKAFPTDTMKFKYTMERRDVLLDNNGRSALVVEQYYLGMSKKMMARSIARVTKRDNKWLINFYSWNMIPRNEDIDKINQALGEP